jgi:hypothetical protein
MWLEEEKITKLFTILHSWLRAGRRKRGVPFVEFESVVAKPRHAFTALPGGRGLLSPCSCLLKQHPPVVCFHQNEPLNLAISNCRTILWESTSRPSDAPRLYISIKMSPSTWQFPIVGLFFGSRQAGQHAAENSWLGGRTSLGLSTPQTTALVV